MRYPVGRSIQDFKDKWYNAQAFGEGTSYGYHEGDDFNLKTGGNSDLGQPLYAIADGIVSSVHSHTTGFGNHVHIRHDKYNVWTHYAHCQEISVVTGQAVTEGQVIGKLGSSGNSAYAHLHFAIKNQPTGIDGIARTREDLAKWENPTVFMTTVITREGNNTPEESILVPKVTFEELVGKSTKFDELARNGVTVESYTNLKQELEGKNAVIKNLEERWTALIEKLATILGSIADESSIIDFATRLSGKIDEALKYQDLYEREIQARKADYEAHQVQLGKFDESLHELRDQFAIDQQLLEDKYMKRIDKLQAQVDHALHRAEVAEEALKAVTKFSAFWKLVGKIRR